MNEGKGGTGVRIETFHIYGSNGSSGGHGCVETIVRDLSPEDFLTQVRKLRDKGGNEHSLHKAMWDLALRLI